MGETSNIICRFVICDINSKASFIYAFLCNNYKTISGLPRKLSFEVVVVVVGFIIIFIFSVPFVILVVNIIYSFLHNFFFVSVIMGHELDRLLIPIEDKKPTLVMHFILKP